MAKRDTKQVALGKIKGLTIADALTFFYSRATKTDKEKAALLERRDGVIEADGAILSEGEDNGCYVLCWSWASFEGTEFDKYLDEDEDEANG